MKFIIFFIFLISSKIGNSTVIGNINDKDFPVIGKMSLVLWVENPPKGSLKVKGKKTYRMNQLDKKFIPNLLAIKKGDAVIFENKDSVFHNVFSLNPQNKFDLGIYKNRKKYSKDYKKVLKKKSIPKKTFKNSGKVEVFCNIHYMMNAVIYVFDNSYYSLISKNGGVKLPNLPDGEYSVVIDGASLIEPQNFKIKVKDSKFNLSINLKSVLNKKGYKNHSKKDGDQYEELKTTNEDSDEEFY